MELRQISRHIRTLASLASTRAPVVSCYVDLEHKGWRGEFDERAAALGAAFPHGEGRRWFEHALGRIRMHLRRPKSLGARGLALFARAGEDPFFLPLEFRLPVPSRLEVGRFPHIYRLVAMRDNFNRFAVLVCTGDAVRVLGVSMGEVVGQICDRRPENARRAARSPGEGNPPSPMKRILAEGISVLESFLRHGGYRRLILAGDPRWLALARQMMPRHLTARIWDVVPAGEGDALMDVVHAAAISFADREEEESAATVEWLCEGLKGEGWAVAGLRDSREALRTGAAGCLILDEHFSPEPVRVCADCGRRSGAEEPQFLCPFCGKGLCLPRDEREALVRAAVFSGAHIEIVNHSDTLMRLGGVGCLLRTAPDRLLRRAAA